MILIENDTSCDISESYTEPFALLGRNAIADRMESRAITTL